MPRVRMRSPIEKRKPICLGDGHDDFVTPPIDPRDAKADALKALLPNFLRRRADDLDRIRDAVIARDFDVIKTIGHNLRGNGTSYGFPELSAIGEAIEKSANARDIPAVLRELEKLAAEVERIGAR